MSARLLSRLTGGEEDMFSIETDFWEALAIGLAGLIVLSIVAASLWTYIFRDR